MTREEFLKEKASLLRMMENADSDGEYKYWERKYEILCERFNTEQGAKI